MVPASTAEQMAQVVAHSRAMWRGRTTTRRALTLRAPFRIRLHNAMPEAMRSRGSGTLIKVQLPENTSSRMAAMARTVTSTRLSR